MAGKPTERRHGVRVAAAYPVDVRGQRGRLLAHGRTADISENGLYVVARKHGRIQVGSAAVVEMTVPKAPASSTRRETTRKVVYSCRIVHVQPLGRMLGLGIQFIKKL